MYKNESLPISYKLYFNSGNFEAAQFFIANFFMEQILMTCMLAKK